MIILDKPYVSDYFQQLIVDNKLEVLETPFAKTQALASDFNFIKPDIFIKQFSQDENIPVYSNSENAILWVNNNLKFSNLPSYIEQFKDKYALREKLRELYPNYFFTKFKLTEIDLVSGADWSFPVIIKPSVGFFSMGVYYLENQDDWPDIKIKLLADIDKNKNLYPKEVIDNEVFVVEQFIYGDEFACDAYFDAEGQPVILGLTKHRFAGDDDVSDRVYFTSSQLLKENLDIFHHFLVELGKKTGVKNFPVHVEARKQSDGTIIPIEVNPNRFGGWCTTAELTPYAFGFIPYLYYLNSKKPDWNSILEESDNKVYSLMVLDNSTGVDSSKIKDFDYNKLAAKFTDLLEMRKTNYSEYPVFGFLFARTDTEFADEIEFILRSDLKEFLV